MSKLNQYVAVSTELIFPASEVIFLLSQGTAFEDRQWSFPLQQIGVALF